jgi:putative PIN family toxin of toxin-antitoxin system
VAGPAPLIRVVADANVYVSAAISPRSKQMQLIEAARRGQIVLYMCEHLYQEIEEVLGREKFRRWLTFDEVADFMAVIALVTEWIEDRPADEIPQVCTDPDDNYLVAMCQDAGTNVLVAGDKAVLKIRYPHIHPRRPADALELIEFKHEFGPGYLPGDVSRELIDVEAEGSQPMLNAYFGFREIVENVTDLAQARFLLNLICVPTAVEPFLTAWTNVQEMLNDRGIGTRPIFASPEVAYLKLPPNPGVTLVTLGDVPLPPNTVFCTLQRCPDLPPTPELDTDCWRVFGIGSPWALENIPQRPPAT